MIMRHHRSTIINNYPKTEIEDIVDFKIQAPNGNNDNKIRVNVKQDMHSFKLHTNDGGD